MVKILVEQEYPVTAACELLGLSRSSYYYKPVEIDERELESAIENVAGRFPTYGTRRISHQLRRPPYELVINRKRVQRLMRQNKQLIPQKRRKKRITTNSVHPYPRYPNLVKDLEIISPDQVWVSDITYIQLEKEFVYLAIIMDVFTRTMRGWGLGSTLDQQLTLTALRGAMTINTPQIHHSDQGVQYAAHAYTDLLKLHGVQISMAHVGKAEENGYAERVIRTIKEEEVYLSEYSDLFDARQQIGHFLEDVYNTKRIHSSLGYLTPQEFELAYRLAQTPVAKESPLFIPK
jgi:transposase InsO family protein